MVQAIVVGAHYSATSSNGLERGKGRNPHSLNKTFIAYIIQPLSGPKKVVAY